MPIKQKRGALSILEMMLLAVLLVLVLSNYFKVDLRAKFESPEAQTALSQTRSGLTGLWNEFLSAPVTYLWDAFVKNMQRIHDGQPTDFQLLAPTVPISSNQIN